MFSTEFIPANIEPIPPSIAPRDPQHGRLTQDSSPGGSIGAASKNVSEDSDSEDNFSSHDNLISPRGSLSDLSEKSADSISTENIGPQLESIFNLLNGNFKEIQHQKIVEEINYLVEMIQEDSSIKKIISMLNAIEKLETVAKQETFNVIFHNLFNLMIETENVKDWRARENINLLLRALSRFQFEHSSRYTEINDLLHNFKREYQLTFSEKIFRYAIALNAGLGSGSCVFGVTTSILLNPYTISISGGVSILICVIIAKYFLSSYSTEDNDLGKQLKEDELVIQKLAVEEAENRIKCYKSLFKIRNLIIGSSLKDEGYPADDNKLLSLIIHNPNLNQSNVVTIQRPQPP